jgi:hypothetical protein
MTTFTEPCVPRAHDPRPAFRRCQCESKGLRAHMCSYRTEFVLERPLADPREPATILTRGWSGGPLPLCSPCRAEYVEHGYEAIIPLKQFHEEASHGKQ